MLKIFIYIFYKSDIGFTFPFFHVIIEYILIYQRGSGYEQKEKNHHSGVSSRRGTVCRSDSACLYAYGQQIPGHFLSKHCH